MTKILYVDVKHYKFFPGLPGTHVFQVSCESAKRKGPTKNKRRLVAIGPAAEKLPEAEGVVGATEIHRAETEAGLKAIVYEIEKHGFVNVRRGLGTSKDTLPAVARFITSTEGLKISNELANKLAKKVLND